MKIDQQIKVVNEQLTALVNSLNAMIAALPDNPRIQRLGKQCFVVRSKDVGNNWAPEHHDFRWQYQAIIKTIQKARTDNAIGALQDIIASKKVKGSGCSVNLHPDVVTNLKTLLS
jgi:hypothetical protein